MLILIGGNFLTGAYAHKLGYTAKLRGLLSKAQSGAQSMAAVIENNLQYLDRSSLPDLYLDVPFLSQGELRAAREEALRIGILNASDDNFVPVSIPVND